MRPSCAALALWLLAVALPAATYAPMSDGDLFRLAPVIVRAGVLEREVRLLRVGDEDLPFTVVTLEVLEAFKGAVPAGARLRLRLPGGASGNRTWVLPGTPQFSQGEEVVVAVDAIADGSGEFRLTEFGLSRFTLLVDDSGRRFAVRPAFSAEADLRLSRVALSGDAIPTPARDAESLLAILRGLEGGASGFPVAYATPMGRLRRLRSGMHAAWSNIGGFEPTSEFRWSWDTGASPTATVVISGTQSSLGHDDPCGEDSACYVLNAVTEWSGVEQTRVDLEGPSPTGNLTANLDAAQSPDGGLAWTTPLPCEEGVIGLGGPTRASQVGAFKGDSTFYAIQSATASFRKFGCAPFKYEGRLFKSVVLHEIGHTLGLGHPGTDPAHQEATSIHSTSDSATWSQAVMHWSIPDEEPTTPQTDDIQAMQYFYGTAAPGPVPVADFQYNGTSGLAGYFLFEFFDFSTNAPTGRVWNFGDPLSGDANVATGAAPYHSFSGPGSYTVTLLSGNSNGSSTLSKTVLVEKVPRLRPAPPPGSRSPLTAPPRPREPS